MGAVAAGGTDGGIGSCEGLRVFEQWLGKLYEGGDVEPERRQGESGVRPSTPGSRELAARRLLARICGSEGTGELQPDGAADAGGGAGRREPPQRRPPDVERVPASSDCPRRAEHGRGAAPVSGRHSSRGPRAMRGARIRRAVPSAWGRPSIGHRGDAYDEALAETVFTTP